MDNKHTLTVLFVAAFLVGCSPVSAVDPKLGIDEVKIENQDVLVARAWALYGMTGEPVTGAPVYWVESTNCRAAGVDGFLSVGESECLFGRTIVLKIGADVRIEAIYVLRTAGWNTLAHELLHAALSQQGTEDGMGDSSHSDRRWTDGTLAEALSWERR